MLHNLTSITSMNLYLSQNLTRAVEHVVDPAGDPEVPVLVALGAVARHVVAGEAREVRLLEPLVVPKHRPHYACGESENSIKIRQPHSV